MIISAILGLFTSALPNIFKIVNSAQDNKHELAILDRQIEAQKSANTQRLDEINLNADAMIFKAAHDYQPVIKNKIVAALNDLFRPWFSYVITIAWICVKIARYHLLADATDNTVWQNIAYLWGPEDMEIFSFVITFWFGSRHFAKNK